MYVGKMEISEEFAADLLEDLRTGATAAFRRSLTKVAIAHATGGLSDGKARKAPDLVPSGEPGEDVPF